MLIQADKEVFHLSLKKVSDNLRVWWMLHEHDADTIELAEGRKVDFSRKSAARVALKMAITPIAIPALRMLYKTKGAEPRAFDRKNEDMFDYIVDVLLAFVAVLDDGYLYVETIPGSGSNDRYIQSISSVKPNTTAAIEGPRETENQESEERPGGETLVHSGEDWYGEDVLHQNGHRQET